MIKFFTTILSLITIINMQAQTNIASPVGEYYLQGVMETAAGFKINGDSTFNFFFSYGALDRQGEGIWKVEGSEIVFNSNQNVKDFIIEQSQQTDDKAVIIKLTRTNPNINKYFHAHLFHANDTAHAQSNAEGIITFPLQKVDSVKLFFEWCPEKITTLKIEHPDHNYFIIQLQPTILDVLFTNTRMKLDKNGILGMLPFSEDKLCNFIKNG